jgi:hypothetical protein
MKHLGGSIQRRSCRKDIIDEDDMGIAEKSGCIALASLPFCVDYDKKLLHVLAAFGPIELALVDSCSFFEERSSGESCLFLNRACDRFHVIETASSIGFSVGGNPGEDICPKPPLQGDGIYNETCQEGGESPFIPVFIRKDDPTGLSCEFKRTPCLCEREALWLIDRRALCADKLTERGTAAGTG